MNGGALSDMPAVRPVVTSVVAMCVTIAIAPWFSGGQRPMALLFSVFVTALAGLMLWREPAVRRLSWGPLTFTYGLLAAWGALSLLWSVNRFSSMLWIIGIVMAGLIFRLAYSIAREEQGRELLVRLYLASCGAFTLYGLWLYATGEYPRLTGSFYWANPAAAYLMPALFITWHRLTRYNMVLWAGMFVLFASAFVLTDSRGGTLALLVVAVPYLLVSKGWKGYWKQLLFTLLAVVVLTMIMLQLRGIIQNGVVSTTPGARFQEAALGESRSGKDRINYLISSLNIFAKEPLHGTGAGTFKDVHPSEQIEVVSASSNPHNFYVQMLPELGIVGFILVVMLVVMITLGMIRGLWKGSESLPLVAGAVALLIHMGVDIDASYPALLGLTAMLAGVTYSQGVTTYRAPSWAVPALAAILIAPVMSYYQGSVLAERGSVYQADGDLEQAADAYAGAHAGIMYDPDWINAEGIAHYVLAATGFDTPYQTALALDRAHQAQDQDPRDSQHHQLEGRILALKGQMPQAVDAFDAALILDPNNHPDYAYDLARVQARIGDVPASIATAKAMLEKYPKAVIENRSADTTLRPALVGLATLKGTQELSRGDLTAAVASAELAAMYDPRDFRTRGLQSAIKKAAGTGGESAGSPL